VSRSSRPRDLFKPHSEWLGDTALELRFGDDVSLETNQRVHVAAQALRAAQLPGVIDIVPAYAAVTLVLGEHAAARRSELQRQVRAVLANAAAAPVVPRRRLLIVPVAYGGVGGPDLDEVARRAGLDADEVVRRHSAVEYVVGMLGFLPGFAYLIGLDPSLAMPRRSTPRVRVPAGSLGIGGAQTGIYPCVSPGGWQLIGRVGVRLFDPRHDPPTLVEPGDKLKFRPVAADALDSARVEVRRA
jgi:KipI family sensor histidine kinase inhibitor